MREVEVDTPFLSCRSRPRRQRPKKARRKVVAKKPDISALEVRFSLLHSQCLLCCILPPVFLPEVVLRVGDFSLSGTVCF